MQFASARLVATPIVLDLNKIKNHLTITIQAPIIIHPEDLVPPHPPEVVVVVPVDENSTG